MSLLTIKLSILCHFSLSFLLGITCTWPLVEWPSNNVTVLQKCKTSEKSSSIILFPESRKPALTWTTADHLSRSTCPNLTPAECLRMITYVSHNACTNFFYSLKMKILFSRKCPIALKYCRMHLVIFGYCFGRERFGYENLFSATLNKLTELLDHAQVLR